MRKQPLLERRDLRVWLGLTMRLWLGLITVMAVLLGFRVLTAPPSDYHNLFSAWTVIFYLQMMTAWMVVIFSVSLHRTYVPLLLSFGASRRSVFWGTRLLYLLPVFLNGLLTFILTLCLPGDEEGVHTMLPLLCLLIFALASIGDLIGMLAMRGKGWFVASMIFIGSVCGIGGGVLGMLFVDGIRYYFLSQTALLICYAVVISVILAANLVSALLIRHAAVKF